MALKSPLWFLGKALTEERNRTPLAYLSSRALDLGLRRTESTRGHMFQAIGAAQMFLERYPRHRATIRSAPPLEPYKPSGQVLRDWKGFLNSRDGEFGRRTFGYNYDTLKGYLTKKYNGNRTGGGGGDNEFEIAIRLCASFIT